MDSKLENVKSNIIRHNKQVETTNCEKKSKYQLVILVEVKLACVIYKLFHDSSLLTCNELFRISKSTIGLIFHEVIQTMKL